MTMFFLFVIMGATDPRAPAGFAPIAIGLCLTLIHLISIPVTNTSVNPARSTGVALFVGGWAIAQLWLFWIAPIAGARARRRGVQVRRPAGEMTGGADEAQRERALGAWELVVHDAPTPPCSRRCGAPCA